ncbi:hypothetical protein F5883DRAFT_227773 [Diaporthe sp. PMI_573]|nr:hypothetical protein F5883DRAFT_227773 [Diaporthaceae sp. PMI_573]
MNRIKYDLDVDGDLLPADFFDLIGGTSTGGLIALLLGRLRRSVPQARREYVRIAEEVFSLPRYLKKNTFDGQKLEEAVKRLLGNDRSDEKMLEKDGSCKAFVCAVPQQDVKARAGPRLFRTYRVRENASFNCTIWEACRATSAAPSYFEPIKIGDDGERETFVDGGLGYNNPVEQVLEEARRIFPGRKVACVVSVGTGVANVIAFPDSPKTGPVTLINALKNMATESDTTAEKIHWRFQNVQDTYFRFSVDRGLQGIRLEEWKELSKVRTFTTEHLNQHIISEQVNKVVRALLASKIVGEDGSNRLIQLPGGISAETGGSHGLPRTLEWRPNEGPIPSFRYTTEQLASHIVGSLSKRHWTVPFGRNDGFVGRGAEIEQLLARTPPEANKDNCQLTAIEGLGGVGKTQVALEVAFRIRDQHPDCSIFWVPAVDVTSFENAYRKIGQELKVAGIDEDKADVKTLVVAALSREDVGSWLLVVDNADDADLFGNTTLADHLPSSPKGSILFTTRNHKVVGKLDIPKTNVISVQKMSSDEALELLRTHLEESQLCDMESTTKLLELLTYLPLAIRQASAYMAMEQISTTKYLGLCQSSEDIIKQLSKDFKDRHRYQKGQENAVATTWLVSFKHISHHDPLAASYLTFMCFLAEKDIPQSLLPPAKEGEVSKAIEAIGTLKAYAFITQREEQDAYDIHRLIRLATQNWLQEKKEWEECTTSAIHRLAEVFPPPKHENRDIWMKYLPHAQTALEFRESAKDKKAERSFLSNVGNALYELGRYKEAEQLHRQTLEPRQQALGAAHPDTLGSMNNVANALHRQGKHAEAEQLHRQTLALRQQGLGAAHPDTLASMNNVASTLSGQGKHAEAEQLHRQTLELRQQGLGAAHPSTLGSMNNVANALSGRGKHAEAEQLHRQTLALRQQGLGAAHPSTLGSMNNVALALSGRGKHAEAEQLHRQTLELMQQALGPAHPDTLRSRNNLTKCLKAKEAEEPQP